MVLDQCSVYQIAHVSLSVWIAGLFNCTDALVYCTDARRYLRIVCFVSAWICIVPLKLPPLTAPCTLCHDVYCRHKAHTKKKNLWLVAVHPPCVCPKLFSRWTHTYDSWHVHVRGGAYLFYFAADICMMANSCAVLRVHRSSLSSWSWQSKQKSRASEICFWNSLSRWQSFVRCQFCLFAD